MFIIYTIISEARVRTSEGEACFLAPAKNSKSKPTTLHNDLPNKWVKLPVGTKFQLCAKFEKTDTFMLSIERPDGKGGYDAPIGIVLRRMSYNNLLGGLVEKVAPVVVEEPKVQAATITPEAPVKDDTEITTDNISDGSATEDEPAEEVAA